MLPGSSSTSASVARSNTSPICLLIADRHVRILTGDSVLIRDVILDPTRNYQREPAQIGPGTITCDSRAPRPQPSH